MPYWLAMVLMHVHIAWTGVILLINFHHKPFLLSVVRYWAVTTVPFAVLVWAGRHGWRWSDKAWSLDPEFFSLSPYVLDSKGGELAKNEPLFWIVTLVTASFYLTGPAAVMKSWSSLPGKGALRWILRYLILPVMGLSFPLIALVACWDAISRPGYFYMAIAIAAFAVLLKGVKKTFFSFVAQDVAQEFTMTGMSR